VYGLSAVVASISASLACAVLTWRPPERDRIGAAAERWRGFRPLAASLAVVAAIGVWGGFRIRNATLLAGGEPVRVGLIQGNVEQGDKWNDRLAADVFRRYLDMSREAVAQGASFVLW